jgi:hypothetical protein
MLNDPNLIFFKRNMKEYQNIQEQLLIDHNEILQNPLYNSTIAEEKGMFPLFRLHKFVWKKGHIPSRMLDMSTIQLPFDSVLHILDNLHQSTILDTVRVSENPFIQNEQGRKVLFNITAPYMNGPISFVANKFIYRTNGLMKNIFAFRTENVKMIRTLQNIKTLPKNREVLWVINYNPLFRMRYLGMELVEYRRITNLLATILNVAIELSPFERMQYIHIPLNREFYFRVHFLKSALKITRATAKFNSAHFVMLMHFINFIRRTATTSIYRQLPQELWSKINLIFTHKRLGFIYNLQDLYNMNEKDLLLLRVINHFNTLILSQDENIKTKTSTLEELEAQAEKEDQVEGEDTVNPNNNKVIQIDSISIKKDNELAPSTSEDDKDTLKSPTQVIQVKLTDKTDDDTIDQKQDEEESDKIQAIVNKLASSPVTTAKSLANKISTVINTKEEEKDKKKIYKSITFAKSDIPNILQQLVDKNFVITTKVGVDKDKYLLNDLCVPDFNKKLILKVIEKTEYASINQHPYIKDLTDIQIEQIKKNKDFVVLKLELIEGKVILPKTSVSPEVSITPSIQNTNKEIQDFAANDAVDIVIKRNNLTQVTDQTDKELVKQRGKNLIEAIDQEALNTINYYPDLTPVQIERFKKLSQNYKTIKIEGTNQTVEELLTQPISTKIEKKKLDKTDFENTVLDDSMLKSSIVNFDQEYLDKQFKKDLYSTLISFNSNGLFVQDIKSVEQKDPLSHLLNYSIKLEDINGKASTLHFAIPAIDKNGHCRINGVKQIMKKQMIALPICKTSPIRVSLASNFNKTIVERNQYKANSFNYFFMSLINALNKDNSDYVKIVYGKHEINEAISFDYANLAKLFTSIDFPITTDKENNRFGIKFYFNYTTREDSWNSIFSTEKISDFESSFGVYCGYLTYSKNIALFLDLDNQLRLVDISSTKIQRTTDILTFIHDSYFPNEKPKEIFEYVDLKILDKKFPLMFILGFQYGLIPTLDYLKVDYKLIPKKQRLSMVTDQDEIDSSRSEEENQENSKFKLNNVRYLNEITQMGLKNNEAIIIGSGVLALYDLIEENQDIDLVVTEKAFKRLTNDNRIVTHNGIYHIRDTHLDLGNDEETFSFTEWLENSIPIGDYRFATLEMTRKFYETLIIRFQNNTSLVEKYQKRIAIINTYLNQFDSTKDDSLINVEEESLFVGNNSGIIKRNNFTSNLYIYYVLHNKEEEKVIKKYGICSPRELYKRDPDLFHKVYFAYYEYQTKKYFNLQNVTDANILTYLDTDPTQSKSTSNNIKFSFIPQKSLPEFSYGLEYAIDISKLAVAYPTSSITIIQGTQAIPSRLNLLAQIDIFIKTKEQAYASLSTKNIKTLNLRYKNILHLAVNIPIIPTNLVISNLEYIPPSKSIRYSSRNFLPNKNVDIEEESTETLDNIHIQPEYKLKPTDLTIKFKDYYLVFNRYPLQQSLIVAGLTFFKTDTFNLEDFNNKDVYYNLLMSKNTSINYLKGITDFFRFFIDPITRDILEQMNEPTNPRDLLIRSTELLSTEDYREVSSTKNHRVRSYERIPAILYNEIARQLASHTHVRSRKTGFTVNPKSVYQRILKDQAFSQVDELNPIKSLKEISTFTFAGQGGRTSRAFVKPDRVFPKDGAGVISENTPTSQNVALVAGFPIDPVVFNTRGFVSPPENPEELEPSNYLDPTSLLIPGVVNDDQ